MRVLVTGRVVGGAGVMRTVNPRFMTEPRGFWEAPVDGFRAVHDERIVAASFEAWLRDRAARPPVE